MSQTALIVHLVTNEDPAILPTLRGQTLVEIKDSKAMEVANLLAGAELLESATAAEKITIASVTSVAKMVSEEAPVVAEVPKAGRLRLDIEESR